MQIAPEKIGDRKRCDGAQDDFMEIRAHELR